MGNAVCGQTAFPFHKVATFLNNFRRKTLVRGVPTEMVDGSLRHHLPHIAPLEVLVNLLQLLRCVYP